MVTSFFWGMQGLHHQWTLGVLPDEEWGAWNDVICGNMAFPWVRWVWVIPLNSPQVSNHSWSPAGPPRARRRGQQA